MGTQHTTLCFCQLLILNLSVPISLHESCSCRPHRDLGVSRVRPSCEWWHSSESSSSGALNASAAPPSVLSFQKCWAKGLGSQSSPGKAPPPCSAVTIHPQHFAFFCNFGKIMWTRTPHLIGLICHLFSRKRTNTARSICCQESRASTGCTWVWGQAALRQGSSPPARVLGAEVIQPLKMSFQWLLESQRECQTLRMHGWRDA